jgi:Glycosyltransferase (GlcNAc)
MAVIRRRTAGSACQSPAIAVTLIVLFIVITCLFTVTDDVSPVVNDNQHNKPSLRSSVVHKRQQLQKALRELTAQKMPMRLLKLREKNEIVGEHLGDIRAGTETVEEVLHGSKKAVMNMGEDSVNDKPPMELSEIKKYLEEWIQLLHANLVEAKHATYQGIWQTYHDLAVKTLYPWDREYLQRMPPRRDDGSIFLSLATYRDENCLNTVKGAFGKAKNPEKLFIGLVQQNCHENCRSGVLEGGKKEVSEFLHDRHYVIQ